MRGHFIHLPVKGHVFFAKVFSKYTDVINLPVVILKYELLIMKSSIGPA